MKLYRLCYKSFALKFLLSILSILLIAAQCVPPPSTQQPTVTLIPTPVKLEPDLIDQLFERGVIKVGIRVWAAAEFSPPAFRGGGNAETGGRLNGFEIDIARLLAKGLRLELELIEARPQTIISGNWQGEWDIALASLTPFDQLSDRITFSSPYAYMPMGILVSAKNEAVTIDNIAGKRVGVLEYSASYQLLQQLPADIEPVIISNLVKAIHQLGQENSEVDIIFGSAPVLQEAVKSGLPLKFLPLQNFTPLPLSVAITKQDNLKSERLVLEINKILGRMQKRGELAEIYLRWYGQDLSR